MNTVFGLNYFVFCLLLLVVVLYFTKDLRNDGYLSNVEQVQERFTSPGTMTQLASTHADTCKDVNRKPDQDLDDEKQKRLTELALRDMTDAGSFTSDYAPAAL
jgi:hypothetical protein